MGGEKSDDTEKPEEKKSGLLSVFKKDYPKRILFIIGNEFCERFCFYGMKAVLQTYLMTKLGQDADTAASLYHAFAIVCYFTPLIGGVMADSFLGRYWTIVSLSTVYVIGNIIMATTAIGTGYLEGALVGMFTIALGTGGIKPCVAAFGADQFSANQMHYQKTFFSMFYITVNAGALISQFVTPLVKGTPCFGESECWVLAFGLPAGLMITALILFLIGTPYYTMAPVTENIAFKMVKATGIAIGRSCCCYKYRTSAKHWLDRAVPDFTQQFVDDCKAVLRVLVLFIPLPFFWALFDQKGSRWTLQAQKMNTYIDFFDIYLEAEQIQIMNGIFVVCFVPIFDTFLYPLFAKCNLFVKPLQRMVLGCALAGLSFVAVGVFQLAIQQGNDPLDVADASTFRTRAYNVNPVCSFDLYLGDKMLKNLGPYDYYNFDKGAVVEGTKVEFKNIVCTSGQLCTDTEIKAHLTPRQPISAIFFDNKCTAAMTNGNNSYPLNDRGEPGEYLYQILVTSYTPLDQTKIKSLVVVKDYSETSGQGSFTVGPSPVVTMAFTKGRVPSYYYKLRYVMANNSEGYIENIKLLQGGAYTIYLTQGNDGQFNAQVLIDKDANAVSVYWQALSYLILTWGEIAFSITGLSFAFSQAPASMKSILTAGWYLTSAFGNVIDLIVIQIQIPNKAYEFFLFAILMFVVTVVFAIMTYFYTYVEDLEKEQEKADPDHLQPHTVHGVPMMPVPSMPYMIPPPNYESPDEMKLPYQPYPAPPGFNVTPVVVPYGEKGGYINAAINEEELTMAF